MASNRCRTRCIFFNGLDGRERSLAYDYLIVATGVQQSYFGHGEFAAFAPGLKSLNDTITVRDKLLKAFETAEVEIDPTQHRDQLTFALAGAGPTGVEMAGAIADMLRGTLKSEFRRVDPRSARIILIESGARILPTFAESLSRRAQARLTRMGVEIRTNAPVEHVDAAGAVVKGKRIASRAIFWTAGVTPPPVGQWLKADTDRAGRVHVRPDLTVPGRPEVFVIGNTAFLGQNGKPLPGVAQMAIHLAFLPQAGNRLMVVTQWMWSYCDEAARGSSYSETAWSGGESSRRQAVRSRPSHLGAVADDT